MAEDQATAKVEESNQQKEPAEKKSDSETGWRWWLRYVIVPLIGSGGVVAIVVALIMSRGNHSGSNALQSERDQKEYSQIVNHSPTPTPTAVVQPAPDASPQKQTVEPERFYLSSDSVKSATRRVWINAGTTVVAHWNIPEAKNGLIFITKVDFRYEEAREIPNAGDLPIHADQPTEIIIKSADEEIKYIEALVCINGMPEKVRVRSRGDTLLIPNPCAKPE